MARAHRLDAEDFDENGILKDGHSIRVPMSFADQQLREHLRRQHPPRHGPAQFCGPGSVVDATGSDLFVGHRPGFILPSKSNSEVRRLRDATEQQRQQRQQADAAAWRGSPSPPRSFDPTETLRDAHETLQTSTDPEAVRRARQMIDAEAWRTAPQMPAQRDDASRGYRRAPPPPTAPTAVPAADAEALRDQAQASWEQKRQQALNAWKQP